MRTCPEFESYGPYMVVPRMILRVFAGCWWLPYPAAVVVIFPGSLRTQRRGPREDLQNSQPKSETPEAVKQSFVSNAHPMRLKKSDLQYSPTPNPKGSNIRPVHGPVRARTETGTETDRRCLPERAAVNKRRGTVQIPHKAFVTKLYLSYGLVDPIP